jgi:glyceraldehyde 3-phosphate dehydrogenase
VKKIAINGFGRIGRCLIRAFFEHSYPDLELVAINSPSNIETLAHLLKYDSIHGGFKYELKVIDDTFIINDKKIKLFHEKNIEKLPWQDYGIDIVLESSGKYNDKDLAIKHIAAGAKKVIVSAPCDGADATIVYGVNHHLLDDKSYNLISIGSCTTNALAPLAKILNDAFTIEAGFMTTIHAYTNDQNIIDNSHKDLRRARAASLSIIPTTTGAAKSIGIVIPELEGKLEGSAIRVPTPNVSMIDFSFVTKATFSKKDINHLINQAAHNEFKNIISIASAPLVSIDYNHTPYSAIFDPYETKVINKNFGRIIAWYDNEWGFSCRMLDIAHLWAKNL